jgi:hypothetical protein
LTSTATDLAHIANCIANKSLHTHFKLKATVYVSAIVIRMMLNAMSESKLWTA